MASMELDFASNAELATAIEIEKGHVYFVCLKSRPQDDETKHFFTVQFSYEPFFADFGPLNMSNLYHFCEVMRKKKKDFPNKKIYFYSDHDSQLRANNGYLICAYQVLVLNRSGGEAYGQFRDIYPPFLPFRDASFGVSTFNITVLDCLQGLYRAKCLGWVNLDTFDVAEYEHYERVENGDWNWIIPDKLMAFSSPHDPPLMDEDGQTYISLTPGQYIPIFRPRNVTTVVRLNNKTYDHRKFTDYGVKHHDLYFEDGGNPSDGILKEFLEICEAEPGAVAVHCKAGLGRTGTLIGCYMMKHFQFTATEAIAWMRIMRPGCVLGPQQQYMKQMESRLARMGAAHRKAFGSSPQVMARLGAKNVGPAKPAAGRQDPSGRMKVLPSSPPGPNSKSKGAAPRKPKRLVTATHDAILKRTLAVEQSLNGALEEAPNNMGSLSRLMPALEDTRASNKMASTLTYRKLAPAAPKGRSQRLSGPGTTQSMNATLQASALGRHVQFQDGTLMDHMLGTWPAAQQRPARDQRPSFSLVSCPMDGPPKPLAPLGVTRTQVPFMDFSMSTVPCSTFAPHDRSLGTVSGLSAVSLPALQKS
mmetsp:Transcript_1972/g.3875  ORF Transcript_1972/g.3875 Transcript_1972/m.3875 type:complete len:588 (-) Transcript_1972:328-2091(-)